jgi:hypothetical protein
MLELLHQRLAALGNQPVHIRLDIAPHIRVRVLIDTDAAVVWGTYTTQSPLRTPLRATASVTSRVISTN